MTLSREGRPSGEAYIELADQDDIPLAEKKHNQHMGRRYIEGIVKLKSVSLKFFLSIYFCSFPILNLCKTLHILFSF